MNARELRDRRAGLKIEAQSILDKAKAEARDLTVEERGKFDAISAQIDALAEDIRRVEKMDALNAEPSQRAQGTQTPDIGMSDKEIQKYSIMRAINAAVSKDWSHAGLEKEASDAVAKRFGRTARSFFLPNDVMIGTIRQRELAAERRDMTVGTPTAGGYLVQTSYPLPMIELLRNRMILTTAGATMLSGLIGDVAIPKHTAAGTGYWLAESGAPTESQQTLGQVGMTPHTFGAYTDISHKLLIQSSLDVENFVRDDLARVIALGIDYAGLHGDDSADANQPDGIASTSGIGSVVGGTNGAAPDWSDIVSLETEVAVDNADMGTMAYVTNAKVRGKLKTVFTNATYGEIPLWNNGTLNGYNALVSNQVRANLTKGSTTTCSAIFFGNWADLVMGMWGDGVDILVDPYSLSTQRAIRVVAFQDVDFAVRHAESFAAMLDATT